MKKRFGLYSIIWAVLVALFNIISFVSPGWGVVEKYTPSFWIGYVLITLMLVGQLICSWFALKEENNQKVFYRLPLIRVSYAGLIVSFVVGGICMLFSPLVYWIGVIVCAIVLGVTVIAVAKAAIAVNEVERIDTKVKTQTFFIKALTVDADSLMARAGTEEIKAECKKVYEAIRYSDPMSHEALASVESQITVYFTQLADAVIANDTATVQANAKNVLILVNDRNQKCRLLK